MISPRDPRFSDYMRLRAELFDKQRRDRSSGRKYSQEEIDKEIAAILARRDRYQRGNGSSPPAASKADVASPGPVANGVPFMITAAMKAALRDRGYTDEAICETTPAIAHQILRPPPSAPAEPARSGGYTVEMDRPTDGTAGPPPSGDRKPSQNSKQVRPLDTFSAAEFEGVEPPPQRWLVKDRVPMRAVTLLAGDGATGKTTIALQLCVCTAGGLSGWLNAVVDEHGPVLFYTAEEDKDELHRRLRAITTHHQIRYPSNLHVHCATELNPQLAAVNRGRLGQLEPTLVYEALRLKLETLRPKLVVLESLADLFGGDEINRGQVRLFITFLRKLARDFDCAVILLSHPSVRGMADDSGTSGNTAWHNSVRARMYFKTVGGSPELRKLEVKKNNYGPSGEIITLQWAKGVYVPEPQSGSLERQAAEQKIDDLFMTILRRFTRQNRPVSDKPSPSYAPAVFAGEPEAKDTPKAQDEFKRAMTRLLAGDRIKVVRVGPPSRRRSIIVEASEVAADLFQDKGRDDA